LSACQVNNRKATHAERESPGDHHALIVRPSVRYSTAHPVEHESALMLIGNTVLRDKTSYATHGFLPNDEL